MKSTIALSLCLLIAFFTRAQTRIYSTATGGNWNAAATWAGGVVPGAADTADIIAGSTVIANSTSVMNISGLSIAGTLGYTATAAAINVNGNVVVMPGGDLQVCSGATGRSLIIRGNLTNNGNTEFSKTGTVVTMGQAASSTAIGGTNAVGVIRQLTVDNSNGVSLGVTVRISQTLRLQNGTLQNGSWLTINNLDIGAGTSSSQCFIQRSQVSQLAAAYTLGSSAALYLNYFYNSAATAAAITEGYEIPSSRSFHKLTINNSAGLLINDDVTLRSTVAALELTAGIITVASGKTIICNSVSNGNTAGSSGSFINGGIALAVGTSPVTRIFPVGSGGQKRTVTLEDLVSTGGTALVRFAIEAASGNTPGSGMRSIKGPRRWQGSLLSGTGITYTAMSVEYGSDDDLSTIPLAERAIASAAVTAGPYAVAGAGANTSAIISTAGGNYSTLGFFALGGRSLPVKIFSTATGGNWNSSTSWTGGVVPVATDTAVIIAGSTITVNSSSGTSAALAEISGTLNFTASAAPLTIEGNLVVHNTGVLQAYNGTAGKQVIVKGDFVNNGALDFSKNGSVLSMAEAGRATTVSGSGTAGVFRQFTIDNTAGVTLSCPVSVSNLLLLSNGNLFNSSFLTVDNTAVGAGPSSSQCIIQRSQVAALGSAFILPASAALYVSYTENSSFPASVITEGYEIPASRSLFRITANNSAGIILNDDITLRSSVTALVLTNGVVTLPAGKTLICNSVSNSNTSGSATSFIAGGGVAMAVGTTAINRIFPVGSKGQNRRVTLSGLSSATGVLLVRIAVTDTSVGTPGTGVTALSPVRRWQAGIISGSLQTCTGIAIDYGADDSINNATLSEHRLALSGSLTGIYNSVGAGSSSASTVSSPVSSYSVTGWMALATELPPGTDYYVALSGNDTADGKTPATAWKTLDRVNSAVFNSTDRVRFNRGDNWYGSLKMNTPGVTVDAYGTGSLPVISGNDSLSGWTLVSGNIWSASFSAGNKPAAVRQLSRNGIVLPLSRHPNKTVNNGYLNFESHVSNTQITDNELPASPSWAGAEVVVRAYKWRLVRTRVSTHSGNTLTIPASDNIELKDGFGYFFVNDLKAVDEEGEWAYNSSTGTVYLYTTTDPNTASFSYAKFDTLVNISGANHVTIKHLHLRNAGRLALLVSNASQCMIDSSVITESGGDGVILDNAAYTTFSHNEVRRVNWSGLFSNNNSAYQLIEHNLFHTIGHETYGKSKSFIGIDCNSPNSIVQYNTVTNTGYSGIISAGVNNSIRRNRVDSVCMLLDDNGGIYTNNNINNTTGTVIEENIVTNSIGESAGAPGKSLSNGIYLDNRSQGITVRNNTVAWVNGSGLFIHDTQKDIVIQDNTSFASGERGEMVFASPYVSPDFVIERNILATADTSAAHFVLGSETRFYSYEQIGRFDTNYLVNPYHPKVVDMSSLEGDTSFTIPEWQAAAPRVKGTQGSPVTYSITADSTGKFRLYYNYSNAVQTWALPPGLFVDARNQEYCGEVSVPPYRSVLLFFKDSSGCVPAVMKLMPQRKAAIDSSVTIYPNPSSSGVFVVRTTKVQKGMLLFQVYEAGGKLVWQSRRTADSSIHQVNLTGKPKGAYLLKMSVNERPAKAWSLIIR